MGLFGDIDINEIPEDPFFVVAGTYRAVLTKLGVVKSKTGSNPGLSTQFTIDDDDAGKYNGLPTSKWHTLYPNATKEDVENDDDMSRQMSYLRKWLSQIGVPASEHDSDIDFDEYLGRAYLVTITNSVNAEDPEVKYSNIQRISSLNE